jgi:tRNA modification GTPase
VAKSIFSILRWALCYKKQYKVAALHFKNRACKAFSIARRFTIFAPNTLKFTFMSASFQLHDTIIALATPHGRSAIALLRLSGKNAIALAGKFFKTKDLSKQPSHTQHVGRIVDEQNQILDEVVVGLYRAPRSFTGEDVVEISCHGSPYIIRELMQLFIRQGARLARAGEFTQRAFLNGKIDLAQAEAVADLIASETQAAHRAALYQMRGGFSKEIKALSEKLLNFVSLVELELDFGEEDVEFADRSHLKNLVLEIRNTIQKLIQSFALGNAVKNGIPTVIAGRPNAGKSTLLNALFQEEKAIVSDIAGTTRDFIEDELIIEGLTFRFTDTAGLRQTEDQIEAIGVARTKEKIKMASLLLYVFDAKEIRKQKDFEDEKAEALSYRVPLLMVGNKSDKIQPEIRKMLENQEDTVLISALHGENLDLLQQKILAKVEADRFKTGDTMVTNLRHFESLSQADRYLEKVENDLEKQLSTDMLAADLRSALKHLGEITGEITPDDILGNIFSKFCIGK